MRGSVAKRRSGTYKLPTSSSLHRAMECIGSVVFPHVRSKPGPSARRGTAIHLFIERAVKIGRVQALGEIKNEEIKMLCNAIDLNLFPGYLEPEITFEYDAIKQKGRVVGIPGPRAYPYHENCYYGTADLVGVGEDGKTVIIIDIKTGRKLPKSAKENWQLRLLAVAAAEAYGCVNAEVALAYIGSNGEVEFEWAKFDSIDLSDFAEELAWLTTACRTASEDVSSGNVIDVQTGDHCDWCPAMTYCPAIMVPLKALTEELGVISGTMPQLTPDQLGAAYDKYTTVKEIVKSIDTSLQTMVKSGPLDIGGGYALRRVPHARKIVNTKRKEEFVAWLLSEGKPAQLSVSLQDMDAETMEQAANLGFIIDIKTDSLRKVRA